MIKNFIFLGAPGTGKGTISQELAKKYNVQHISTGEIFRQERDNKTKLGLKIKSIVDNGLYVPNEITNEVIKKNLSKITTQRQNFILDGYPRTIEQAKFLESQNFDIDYVILLESPDDIIIERLLKRGRKDDNEPIIKKRIDIYNDKTKPVVEFYKKRKKFIKINSVDKIPNIISTIEKIFN